LSILYFSSGQQDCFKLTAFGAGDGQRFTPVKTSLFKLWRQSIFAGGETLKREQKEHSDGQFRVIWVLATHACQKRRDNSPSRVPLIRRRRRAASRSDEFL
jgi:hypothetical protein